MNSNAAMVLIDNGIIDAAELAELASEEQTIHWGDITQTEAIHGYRRKVASDPFIQENSNAMVTIGRLIRDGAIAAHTYSELRFEAFRRAVPVNAFNALEGCQISTCPAPIERSKFRQTVNLGEYISKGGKKDRKHGADLGNFNQIPFFEWLLHLNGHDVQSILMHSRELGLTEFEEESFQQLDRFRFICSRVRSRENFPDAFHLWTAERNNLGIFLTMEKTLRNIADQMASNRDHKERLRVSVLSPILLTQLLGVSNLDEVPIKEGCFYHYAEGCK